MADGEVFFLLRVLEVDGDVDVDVDVDADTEVLDFCAGEFISVELSINMSIGGRNVLTRLVWQ